MAKTDVVAAIKARLRETEKEVAALRQALEVLGGPVAFAARSVTKRRRRRMSAAQKKAVSQRMKKYWAARRKAGKSR